MAIGLWPRGNRPKAWTSVGLLPKGRKEVDEVRDKRRRNALSVVLEAVADADGPVTLSQIAAATGYDYHKVRRCIEKLSRQGKVAWDPDDEEISWRGRE